MAAHAQSGARFSLSVCSAALSTSKEHVDKKILACVFWKRIYMWLHLPVLQACLFVACVAHVYKAQGMYFVSFLLTIATINTRKIQNANPQLRYAESCILTFVCVIILDVS